MASVKQHLLLYPFPAPGHVIPLLNLASRLLTRGFSITLLVTPSDLPLLDSILAVHPPSTVQPLVLPFQPSRNSKNRLVAVTRGMRESHYPEIVRWFESHPSPPVAIVSDFFLGWSHHLACQLGIKRLVFSPSGALSVAVHNSLWRDLPKVSDPEDVDGLISFPGVPGRPIYPWWQISYNYRTINDGDSDFDFYRDGVFANLASWGIVFNSFTELEREWLEYAKEEIGHDRVWAVGPLLPPLNHSSVGPAVMCWELLTWLDAREDRSVVYVCFGSRVVLTSAQMGPLANALERSGVHFVLCVKRPTSLDMDDDDEEEMGSMPEGFEDRVADRGFVVKGWAPQVVVLRHRAVGAFLTHCGWNSVLESLSAGKMMLTWPMGADQFSNETLVVDQLRMGVRVGGDTFKIPDPDELGWILRDCVGTNGKRMAENARAKEMSDAANATVHGGSSDKEFDDLISKIEKG